MEDIFNVIDFFNKSKIGITIQTGVVKEKNEAIMIQINGTLDTDNSMVFSEMILKIIKYNKEMKKLILNLQKLMYIASAGVGAFTMIYKECKSHNIELILCEINAKVQMVLETLGFASIFNIVESYDDL